MVNLLHRLCRTRDEGKFKNIVKGATECEMKEFVHGVTEIMRKKVPVSKRCAKMIVQNRRFFRHMVHPKFGWKSKKRYLKQKGGTKGLRALSAVSRLLGLAGNAALGPLKKMGNLSRVVTRNTPPITRSKKAASKVSLASTASSSSSAAGQSAVKRGLHRLSKRVSHAAHVVGQSPVGTVAKAIAYPVRRPFKTVKNKMIEKDIPMHVVKIPAASVATTGAMIGVDQTLKTKPFQHKMQSDADLITLDATGPHNIPTSTPAKKYEKPHYYVNEGSSFTPATQKSFRHNERTERVRVKFDPNASDISGKSPGPVTFERLPASTTNWSSEHIKTKNKA